jgi:three-Cys-motif partner protein
MNQFGGDWTQKKVNIFIKYLRAYLTIMNSQIKNESYAAKWQLIYFDAFAGSGTIETSDANAVVGTALRVLEIDQPRGFDIYYFVEKDKENAAALKKIIGQEASYKNKKAHIVQADANEKIGHLADYLKNPENKFTKKVLAFLDPYGMALKWETIEKLKELSIDIWLLIPTGIGVNRLLKNNMEISDANKKCLQDFLGLSSEEIERIFYKKEVVSTLFGEEDQYSKVDNIVHRIHECYEKKLATIFKYVSEPFVLRNSKNAILYHFLLASNNPTAIRIGNDIIGDDVSKLK